MQARHEFMNQITIFVFNGPTKQTDVEKQKKQRWWPSNRKCIYLSYETIPTAISKFSRFGRIFPPQTFPPWCRTFPLFLWMNKLEYRYKLYETAESRRRQMWSYVVRVDPTTVVCDFEQATINAVTAVHGSHVNVQGCYYHLVRGGRCRSSAWQRCTKTTTTLSVSAVCLTPSPSCRCLISPKGWITSASTPLEMDSRLLWISSITSTPCMLPDRSGAFSVRSPAIGFSRCASVERRRCFHRCSGMHTTWLSQVRTAPTTCASRGNVLPQGEMSGEELSGANVRTPLLLVPLDKWTRWTVVAISCTSWDISA